MTMPPNEAADTTIRYATFTSRMRAVLVDTAVVGGALVAIVVLGDAAAAVPGSGRLVVLLIFVLLFLYEPLFVWRRGATIGHGRNHLIVVSERTGRPPGLGRAFLRYLVKTVFGIVSFGTMPLSRRHQAVHDWLTRTTVRVSPGAEDLVDGFLLEDRDDLDVILPSRSRRVVVGTAYLMALFVAYGTTLAVVDPDGCVRARDCADSTRLLIDCIAVAWLALSVATIAAAWRGLLPGARRRSAWQAEAPLA